MFNDYVSPTNDRPRSALEVAIHAHAQEKNLALVVANYREDKRMGQKKGLLASIIAIFRML